MFEYILGKVVSKQPTHVVLESGGIGYLLNITLNSFDQIKEGENQKIFTWLQVQEDAHRLWGFHNPAEREVFLHLISVSGIGPNTGRLILSGMSPEELGAAFEPYHTTKDTGTGLGLLVVRRIIREHGGEIEIKSEEGIGTEVTVHLPRVDKRMRFLGEGSKETGSR